MLLRY